MSYAVVLMTEIPDIVPAPAISIFTDATSVRTQVVRDTSTGTAAPWGVYDRASLTTGARISGPAIICEDETSTLVEAGWHAVVNTLGYIEMNQETA
jgi:N-methylhydantoinase A